jgi:TonB family protein
MSFPARAVRHNERLHLTRPLRGRAGEPRGVMSLCACVQRLHFVVTPDFSNTMFKASNYGRVIVLAILVSQCAPAATIEAPGVPSVRPFSTSAVLNLPPCATDLVAADSAELERLQRSPSESSRQQYVLAATRPELRNSDQVRRALIREYPADLRDRGVGGSTVHRVLIDSDGRIVDAVLARGSGYSTLDDAARNVVAVMTFYPATYERCRVAYVHDLPVVFTAR